MCEEMRALLYVVLSLRMHMRGACAYTCRQHDLRMTSDVLLPLRCLEDAIVKIVAAPCSKTLHSMFQARSIKAKDTPICRGVIGKASSTSLESGV